jgi:hypothetical protein
MFKSLLLSLGGLKGLTTGLAMAVIWLIGWGLYCYFNLRHKAMEDAKETFANTPGAVEADVIRKYYREQKRYPGQALLTGLAGAGVIVFLFYLI